MIYLSPYSVVSGLKCEVSVATRKRASFIARYVPDLGPTHERGQINYCELVCSSLPSYVGSRGSGAGILPNLQKSCLRGCGGDFHANSRRQQLRVMFSAVLSYKSGRQKRRTKIRSKRKGGWKAEKRMRRNTRRRRYMRSNKPASCRGGLKKRRGAATHTWWMSAPAVETRFPAKEGRKEHVREAKKGRKGKEGEK